jgi:hypothetical protein
VTRLEAHGLGADVPRGWDGAVYRRSGDERAPTPFRPTGLGPSSLPGGRGSGPAGPPMHYPPILHLATFALPADRGDFGSGAIEGMGPRDLFVSVLEFDTGSGTGAMFGHGVPWPLRPDDFSPQAMRVPKPNQSGCQRFFRVGDRGFTLYVVIGSHSLRRVLVPRVNTALAGIHL